MRSTSTRERLLTSTIFAGAAALALAAGGQAMAQAVSTNQPGSGAEPPVSGGPPEALSGTAAGATSATNGTAANTVQEVTVTGSRIAAPNLKSISPVTVVNSQEIKLSGTTRVEDLINQLPQAFAAQGGNLSNGATGTATVNLRNLGTSRTLVLVDGKRLMGGDPAAPAADLNFIPASLIERVDVVTGGASAVYGSDAVAGVVNFIMQKNFSGVRLDAQYSTFQHDNGNSALQSIIAAKAATNPKNYIVPPDSVRLGDTVDITAVIGVNSPDGKGNATVYAEYRNIKPVTQNNYDYSECTLAEAGSTFSCSGSSTTSPARFIAAGGTGSSYTLDPAAPGGNGFRAYNTGRDAFNFGPYNYFQRPDERYSLGAFAHYEVNKALDVYTQLMFMDDRTKAQIAPSGIFLQTLNINCDNPYLSAGQITALCGPTVDQDPVTDGVQNAASRATTQFPAGTAAVAIGKRNLEGGGRVNDIRHTDYRIVLGARGDLGNSWHYDVSAQYGEVIFSEEYINDFSLVRSQRALLVQNVNGVPTCTSVIDGSDPNCVPYNLFSTGGVTPGAVGYVSVPGFQEGTTTEQVVTGSITGQLGDYGIKSPFAEDGVGVAAGAEYRREASELRPDLEFTTGDLAGQGGATLPVGGAFDTYELFTEVQVPIVQNRPFIESLNFNGGYRFSDYSTAGITHTYKFGADYSPIRDVRFRFSYNKAVRAPNIIELFSARNVALDGTKDPCAVINPGDTPDASAAACARTGVTAAQYGNIIANPAAQYNGLTGGNPGLAPEVSDTISFGAVFTPTFLPGFSIAVDYFDIYVDNVIGTVGADNAITSCLSSGTFCNLIVRAPGTGSLWLGTNGYIIDTNLNAGSLETKGVDIEANYRLPLSRFGLDKFGSLSFNLVGTYTDSFTTELVKGQGTYDCVGLYGTGCLAGPGITAPIPQWRHKFRVTWQTPWNLAVTGSWRFIEGLDVDSSSSSPFLAGTVNAVDAHIPDYSYLDISMSYRLKDQYTFRVGVNNVLDNDPPIIGSGHLPGVVGNGNTFPQVWDALGRYLFVGLTADF